jgi:hypothetical protein
MKKLAFHAAAISALLAGSASAADLRRPMPVKAPAPALVAVYSWTGCYVGAGGGYGMFDQKSQLFFDGDPIGFANDNGGRGWFGTVQVGCDYQIGSNIVIGAFGDYDFSGIKGDMVVPFNGWLGEEKLKNSWAAGGRIGWIPFQASQLLVFVSGGYTQARFGQVDFRFPSTGIPTGQSLVKHTYDGWFLGSGYEYGLGFLPGLFWKTEYRFADYGKESANVVTGGVPDGRSLESHKYVQTVRSELVWRFNWSGPAAAYAADVRPLPVKAPAPVVAYNWTGCYVGAGGGYGMFNQETGFRDDGVPAGQSNDVGGRGWFGTVQAGCDYQFGSNIVAGAFGDYDFSGIKGDWSNPVFAVVFGTSRGEEKLKNSWAAGGRIGWIPFQASQLLVYVSGGYTQARFSEIALIGFAAPTGVVIPKHTYAGWFIGSGYEYGLGFLPGLFWKTEYRFADYGSDNIFVQAGGVVTEDSVEQRKYVHTVRSELVWRFNFGGPVVARY